jgi:hypothetical protein
MSENQPTNSVAVLEKVNAAIGSARKDLKNLCEEWAVMNATAKEIARFELCTALVRRLEIAEKEVLELVEMVE